MAHTRAAAIRLRRSGRRLRVAAAVMSSGMRSRKGWAVVNIGAARRRVICRRVLPRDVRGRPLGGAHGRQVGWRVGCT
eukprot:CAMPEP_0206059566 /NCGR_PEP_ID=MMETSP1466-20131121/49334_1 /ASSEMBLY_ACC=CAM_ASM_001126 /TAXON_ID=44452 /ORGANISM="Pavlova gyrans, Strain CCMP608" /LENGTH=77 /DNA_ID=CAMNT_0053434891 /DNA_START=161 /DNA_END=391 /DNA_ORIENTATION=+